MRSLKEIVTDAYHRIGPEIRVDEINKKVNLRDNLFFTHLTRTYYALKGYKIKIE